MNSVRVLWSLFDAREKRRVLLLQLVSLFMAASTLCGIAALVPFLLVVAEPGRIQSTPALAWTYSAFGFHSAHGFLVALGGGFVLVSLLANVINMLGSLALTRFALDVGDRFHVALLDEYLRRELLFHVRTGSVALTSNVIFAVKRVASALIENLELMVTNSMMVLGILASVAWLDTWVAVIAAGWLGAAYAAYYLRMRRKLRLSGQMEGEHAVERARIAGESLQAIREIQIERSQKFFVGEFARACGAVSRAAMSLQRAIVTPRYLLEVLVIAGLVVSALFISAGRSIGEWLAELAFVGLAAYRLLPALQQLFTGVAQIRGTAPIFAAIAPDLLLAGAHRNVAQPETANPWHERPRRSIRLERVCFRYARDRELALDEVSLEIPAGAMACIVGGNGTGKTTLIDVLAGLLTPQSGRLLVDEEPVTPATLLAWQSRIAYVPQQVFLFDTTIAANIALGVPPGGVDSARLRDVLRRVRLDEFVAKLPRGADERVGERGFALSGGQRQRIAIARALYRGAPVLLLDEPTSSLDGATEQELMNMLSGLRGRSTIIMVAHRVQAIRHCDLVFELGASAEAARVVNLARGEAGA